MNSVNGMCVLPRVGFIKHFRMQEGCGDASGTSVLGGSGGGYPCFGDEACLSWC